MNKKKHVLLAGVLGLSTVLTSLTGCGSTGASNDPKALLKTASESFSTTKSYDINLDMVMAMDMKDQGNLDMSMHSTGSIIQKPDLAYQLNSSVDMNIGGQNQTFETVQYVIKEDSNYMMYMNTMDMWTKTPLASAEDVEKMLKSPADNLDMFLEKIDDISIAEELNIEGTDCYSIKVNLTKDYFDAVLSEMDLLSNIGVDEDTLKKSVDTLKDMDALPIYYYVSKENTQLVGMDMDMSSLIKAALLSSEDLTEDQLGDIKTTIHMTVSNLDNVSEIMLPEEAASATEVQM